jgi:hypothetical protein
MTRLLGLLATCCLAVAVAAPMSHADPALSYGCSPPMPATPGNCVPWHNTPVTISWDWDQLTAEVSSGNCSTQVFSQDSAAIHVSCTVKDKQDGTTTGHSVDLKVDRTPPSVTGSMPSRPPDTNGWWNRPLSLTFSGNDALSGIASCDTVAYSGAGGPGAVVTGGCHDVAGNYGVASYPLNYDATPPALNEVKATPESQSAMISWDSADAVRALVTRTAPRRSRASAVVYSGSGNHFRDSGIRNGKTYTYRVTVFDAADNSTSRTVHAKPQISLGLRPRRNARFKRPPRLRWPAIRHADYYNVQLYRGNQKLLTVWPEHAHLKLRRVLHFHGAHIKLRRGHYRWYVWPGFGSRAAQRYGSFIGQSSFVLTR